jgi:hypothetical protein
MYACIPWSIPAGGDLTLTFDAGGSEEFDVPARYRVSFAER